MTHLNIPGRLTWATVAAVLIGAALSAATRAAEPPVDRDGDDESRERLIRRTRGEVDDVMSAIIRLMDRAADRLLQELDPGSDTIAVQQRVLEELDVAISQARDNLRRIKASGQPPDAGREGDATEQEASKSQDESADAGTEDGAAGTSGAEVEAAKEGALREAKRQWGNLPPRQRQEILQGYNEEVQDRYRRQIERYYEALGRDDNLAEPK